MRRIGQDHLGEHLVVPLRAALALESTVEEAVDVYISLMIVLHVHGMPTSACAESLHFRCRGADR